jgi:hypothetical protein
MSCRWRELLLVIATFGSSRPVAAQDILEFGAQAIGTFSDPLLAVAGGYGAVRTSGRTRVSAGLNAGVADSELAWRGELLGHFLLSPEERRKPGFYFAAGLAAVEGAVDRGYLILTLGLEAQPRAASGWALEAGVGGGFRIALGFRWRRFSGLATQ